MATRYKRWGGYALGIGSGLSWGLNAVLISLVLGAPIFGEHALLIGAGALLVSMLHDTFASFGMLTLITTQRRLGDLWRALRTRDALYCFIGALLGGPLAMTCYMLSIQEIGAGLTASITAIYPLLGSIFAFFLLRESLHGRTILGLLISILGVASLSYEPDMWASSGMGWGILLALITAIGWASEGVVCAYGMKSGRIDPTLALCIRELSSALTWILVIAPIFISNYQTIAFAVTSIPASTMGLLIVAAIVGMLSFLMWYTSINQIGAIKALSLNITYSVWAIVFAYLLQDAPLSLSLILGALAIIAGVTISFVPSKQEPS